MSAWHGDAELKARIVERMKQHREADDFIQGVYQQTDPKAALGYKGCAIGCALDLQKVDADGCALRPIGGWWSEVQRQFGIPGEVAELIDDNFESLYPPYNATFAVESLEAIPVGADLSNVAHAYWNDEEDAGEESSDVLLRLLKNAPQAVTDA